MYPQKNILEIDKECTKYLKSDIIINENSFTAVLTIKIYETISSKSCYATVLPRNAEEKFGCDAIIIIKIKDELYAGFWEAKLPRLNHDWNKKEKTGYHFEKQLRLQKNYNLCSWEVFYNNGSMNFSETPDSSLCIWRKDIESFQKKHGFKKWDNRWLLQASSLGKNFEKILDEMANRCIPWKKSEESNTIVNDLQISIPIYNMENQKEIHNFMRKNGLVSYIYIEK
jgi:hypothetical protein